MIKSIENRLKTLPWLVVPLLLVPRSFSYGSVFDITINSPLDGFDTVEGVITAILNALIVIATPIVVLMILYAGFLYVTARGNAEQVTKATTALTYAMIGGLLVIGATAVVGIITNLVADFRA